MSPTSASADPRTARQAPVPAAVTNRNADSISTMVCRTAPPLKCRPAPRARLWNPAATADRCSARSEEHTSELQSHVNLVCRLLLEKKKQAVFPQFLLRKTIKI